MVSFDYRPSERRFRRWWPLLLVFLVVVIVGLALMPNPDSTGDSNRLRSASNLRQIGEAIFLYSNDNHEQYPDSFPTILFNEEVTPDVFVSPGSKDTPAAAPTTQQLAAILMSGGHCSYVYLGQNLNTATTPPDAVVAYEPMAINNNDGGNVLFGDGHVEFCQAPWMHKMLAKLNGRGPAPTMPVTMPSN